MEYLDVLQCIFCHELSMLPVRLQHQSPSSDCGTVAPRVIAKERHDDLDDMFGMPHSGESNRGPLWCQAMAGAALRHCVSPLPTAVGGYVPCGRGGPAVVTHPRGIECHGSVSHAPNHAVSTMHALLHGGAGGRYAEPFAFLRSTTTDWPDTRSRLDGFGRIYLFADG